MPSTSQAQGLSKYPLHQEGYSALKTNVPLPVATASIAAQTILKPITIRVHKSILLLHPVAKLWYLCRASDTKGQGFVILKPEQWRILGAKSTIYRWLREGRQLGFFRSSKWRGDSIEICLGGLLKICKVSGISSWGATADEISLFELLEGNNRRAIASALATQDLQARSHFAAKRQLKSLDKKTFKIPTAVELLDTQTSLKMANGGTHGIVHIGEQRIFAGKRFIPFGVSQALVCEVLNSEPHSCGVSDRTLRRHLDQLGITKRQLMQAKPEYKELYQQLNRGVTKWTTTGESTIYMSPTGRGGIIRLDERAGISSSRREGGHIVDVKQFSRYFGATWLYRCNLYSLSYTLTSMKATRRQWKRMQAAIVPVENSPEIFTPQTPQESESSATALRGGVADDQNKADKNDNPPNVEPEKVLGEIPSIWYETKRKLLEQKRHLRQAKATAAETLSKDPIQQYWQQLLDR